MSETNQRPLKILIVEHDGNLQRSLARAFRVLHLDPVSLVHGWRTIEVAADQKPDAIVVDVDMAQVRSNLVVDLKRDPRTQSIPVFMYSREDTHHDRVLAFELGADDYLGKPFQADILVRRVVLRLDKLGRLPPRPVAPRDPFDTLPDIIEIDRQQVELFRAEKQKREKSGSIRAAAVSRSRPRTVLIVEDDNSIRTSLSHILEDEGIRTLTASNGREALDVIRQSDEVPSVVLLDLMMPVMDGWEFRQRVESDWPVPAPKFIVMSALSPDETIGLAVWLRKPLGVDQLVSTVTRLMCA